MKDHEAEFEKAIASLVQGKRGLGTAPPDEASRFVGACLQTLGRLLSEAFRKKALDRFADVLAWQLAVIGIASGPGGAAGVVGLLEWHLRHMADTGAGEGGQEPEGSPEARPH